MSERNSYPSIPKNRELSWLRFNERVLLEALDEQVPLLERLKFVSIFTSNLDEFFMIRVGSLLDLSLVKGHAPDNKTGLSPKEQLEAIFAAVQPLIAEKDDICRQLQQLLGSYGICRLFPGDLDKADQKYLRQYFQNEVDPILSPQIIDGHHPFPIWPIRSCISGRCSKIRVRWSLASFPSPPPCRRPCSCRGRGALRSYRGSDSLPCRA